MKSEKLIACALLLTLLFVGCDQRKPASTTKGELFIQADESVSKVVRSLPIAFN